MTGTRLREYGVLVFGALAQPLYKQLGVRKAVLVHQQADADAITRLLVRGVLTESAGRRARTRLLYQIKRAVETQ